MPAKIVACFLPESGTHESDDPDISHPPKRRFVVWFLLENGI